MGKEFCVSFVLYDAFRLVDDTTKRRQRRSAKAPQCLVGTLGVGLYRICGAVFALMYLGCLQNSVVQHRRSVFGQHKRVVKARIPPPDDAFPQLQLPRNAYRQIVLPFRKNRIDSGCEELDGFVEVVRLGGSAIFFF